eukprot:s369_g28.t2
MSGRVAFAQAGPSHERGPTSGSWNRRFDGGELAARAVCWPSGLQGVGFTMVRRLPLGPPLFQGYHREAHKGPYPRCDGQHRQEYLCLCEGPSLGEAGVEGTIDAPLLTKEIDGASRSEVSEVFGREAITKYTVVARYRPKQPAAQGEMDREVMLLAVRPKTGRTHQIRVHMASIDCPLAGDLTYGFRQNASVPCPRLFLHCRRIQLLDMNDDVFSAEAKLPQELAEVLKTLEPLGQAAKPWPSREPS